MMIVNDLLLFLMKRLGGPYPLYTHIPERVPHPYLSLEILFLKHKNGKLSRPGKAQALLKIQAWSRSHGPQEIQDMADHIQGQLSDQLLLMDGTGKASCRTLEENTKLLNDRTTRLYETRMLMGIRL